MTPAGDWMVSFDLMDDYYTLGIREEDTTSLRKIIAAPCTG
jgi:hypothetical protein